MRIAKMHHTRMVGPPGRKKLQVKYDIPEKVRHLFDGKTALTRFPKTGESATAIVAEFERLIESAKASLLPAPPPLLRVRRNGSLPWQVRFEHIPAGSDEIEASDQLFDLDGYPVENPTARRSYTTLRGTIQPRREPRKRANAEPGCRKRRDQSGSGAWWDLRAFPERASHPPIGRREGSYNH